MLYGLITFNNYNIPIKSIKSIELYTSMIKSNIHKGFTLFCSFNVEMIETIKKNT